VTLWEVRHARSKNLTSIEKRGTGASRRGRKTCQEKPTPSCDSFLGASRGTNQRELFLGRSRRTHQRSPRNVGLALTTFHASNDSGNTAVGRRFAYRLSISDLCSTRVRNPVRNPHRFPQYLPVGRFPLYVHSCTSTEASWPLEEDGLFARLCDVARSERGDLGGSRSPLPFALRMTRLSARPGTNSLVVVGKTRDMCHHVSGKQGFHRVA